MVEEMIQLCYINGSHKELTMTPAHQTEVVRKVYVNAEGVYLEVAPDSDGLNCVQLRTVDKASQDYFGEFNLLMPKELAYLVGHALIDAAREVE